MQELTSHNKIVYNYQKEKSVLPEISFHTYTIRTTYSANKYFVK